MKTTNSKLKLGFLVLILTIFQYCLSFANTPNYCSDYIRIWGLIKYYTPYQKDFIPNLDSAFQIDIKNILRGNSKNDLKIAIEHLILYSSKSANILKQDANQLSKAIEIDSSNRWISDNTDISKTSRNYLIHLVQCRRSSGNPFVQNDPDNSSANFINEKRFLSPYPSVEIRLLALARYWNVINYFYPHKNLIKINWNTTLDTFGNELILCKDEFNFNLIILRLVSLIDDGHGSTISYIIDKHYGFYQLPCEVSFINNQLFITKILKTAINNPFKYGDLIIKINNKSFEEYYLQDSCFLWGSNNNRKKNICAAHYLRSQESKNLTVRLIRGDSIIDVSSPYINIYSYKDSELISYKPHQAFSIGDKYIYLDLSIIDSIDFEKMVLDSKKPNVIIDLRHYPNWVLNQIADLFATMNLPFAAYKYPEISWPGLFSPPQLLYLKPKQNITKSNYEHIILIVDYTTISRGEFLCMAFQALPNVLTFGDQTAGADGNVSKILLPGNISTQFTGLGILYPDGRPTQQTGVKIDLHFHKTGKAISLGQDEELDYILNTIIKVGEK